MNSAINLAPLIPLRPVLYRVAFKYSAQLYVTIYYEIIVRVRVRIPVLRSRMYKKWKKERTDLHRLLSFYRFLLNNFLVHPCRGRKARGSVGLFPIIRILENFISLRSSETKTSRMVSLDTSL